MGHLTLLLQRSFPLIKRHSRTLWIAAAWPYASMAACYLIFGVVFRSYYHSAEPSDPQTIWYSMGALAKFGVLFAYVATMSLPHGFAMAGTSLVLWANLKGEAVDSKLIFSRIGGIVFRLTILSFFIGLICMVGGMFLLIPGVLGFALMSLCIPVLVIENQRIGTALKRGINLSSMRLGSLFGLYATVLMVLIVVLVAVFLVTALIPAALDLPWLVVASGFWMAIVVVASFLMIVTTAVVIQLYSELRQQGTQLQPHVQPVN